jgi:hypothetical protein
MTSYLHSFREEGLLRELANIIRRQQCALLIGLGLALPPNTEKEMPLTHPGHLKELLRRMILWCIEHKNIDEKETEDDFEKMLAAGDLSKVERKLQEYLDTERRQQCIREVLLQSHAEVRYIYRLLAQIPFRAYITTGFDEFLENEYNDLDNHSPLLKYYRTSLSLDEALDSYELGEPFILKLHGDVAEESPEALTLSNRFVTSLLPEAIIYPNLLRELFADLHTVFMGSGSTTYRWNAYRSGSQH